MGSPSYSLKLNLVRRYITSDDAPSDANIDSRYHSSPGWLLQHPQLYPCLPYKHAATNLPLTPGARHLCQLSGCFTTCTRFLRESRRAKCCVQPTARIASFFVSFGSFASTHRGCDWNRHPARFTLCARSPSHSQHPKEQDACPS